MMAVDLTKLAIIAGLALVVALCAFLHARRHHEGLPPGLDAFFAGVGFVTLCAAFIIGGRLADPYGMVTEGRVGGLAVAVILLRWLRARLGMELAAWTARK
jgi:hypothetical protein